MQHHNYFTVQRDITLQLPLTETSVAAVPRISSRLSPHQNNTGQQYDVNAVRLETALGDRMCGPAI
jgi:hypothetical protein